MYNYLVDRIHDEDGQLVGYTNARPAPLGSFKRPPGTRVLLSKEDYRFAKVEKINDEWVISEDLDAAQAHTDESMAETLRRTGARAVKDKLDELDTKITNMSRIADAKEVLHDIIKALRYSLKDL